MEENNCISAILFKWYNTHKRDLPWRNTRDPYRIWISEIILQQTRIIQGLDYYNRFINRFPDIKTLANATEEEVLKYWEGLGYYSRARNIHATAKTIMEQHDGIFPDNYNELLKLKGIGEYTAAAISSFAWNLPYPAIDGNVFRFLSRLYAIDDPIDSLKGKKYFTTLAKELMNPGNAGLFNQAIMEFGALQCTPAAPRCNSCPFSSQCMALTNKSIDRYPVKKSRVKTKDLFLNYFHIFDDENLLLYKRNEKRIWKNLFEFPLIESETALTFDELTQQTTFKSWFPPQKSYDFKCIISHKKHILSHRILYVNFYQVYIKDGIINKADNFIKIKAEEIDQYPFHRLMMHYIESEIKK